MEVRSKLGATATLGDGLDRRPTHEPRALLICGPGQCQETVAGPSGRLSGGSGLGSCPVRSVRAALVRVVASESRAVKAGPKARP
jgi:hypothetical protein